MHHDFVPPRSRRRNDVHSPASFDPSIERWRIVAATQVSNPIRRSPHKRQTTCCPREPNTPTPGGDLIVGRYPSVRKQRPPVETTRYAIGPSTTAVDTRTAAGGRRTSRKGKWGYPRCNSSHQIARPGDAATLDIRRSRASAAATTGGANGTSRPSFWRGDYAACRWRPPPMEASAEERASGRHCPSKSSNFVVSRLLGFSDSWEG